VLKFDLEAPFSNCVMKKKVLVVDDSALIRRQVAAALEGAGFETCQAVDGIDALEKLAESSDFILIVSDVNMPRMSGVDLLERVRSLPNVAGIPFVILTSDGQAASIQRARQLGVGGYLRKPFKPDMLLAAVHKLAS